MGTVLYEAHYQFSIFSLIPIVMLFFVILFPKIAEKTALQQGKEMPQKQVFNGKLILRGTTK